MNRTTIKDFSGKVIGYIDIDDKGNKVVRKFNLMIVGRYDAKLDVTRDFQGRIIAQGDASASLLYVD